ncbi:hypothetical protein [Sandarakinorhabdus sp. DWP1-3-1]|uniref:hypothetical protein n=1 Tax=Sandarakinorhabdus sp. DWP1-3-1 TaxID=2804627 RepID=UPI003CF41B02
MCDAITALRIDIAASLSARAAELEQQMCPGEARAAVLAAMSLTIGDAIQSWVSEDRWLEDVEKHATLLRTALGGRPEGVTVQ